MSIDWYAIHWQALATVAAGLMAVGGAAFIATRQMAITRRQADISDRQAGIQDRQVAIQEQQLVTQDRQVQLQHFNLRIQLFERRLGIFMAAAEFVAKVRMTAGAVAGELEVKFATATGESQFLFKPAVCARLTLIWDQYRKLLKATKGETADEAIATELLEWFGYGPALAEIFETEMSLRGISGFEAGAVG